MFGALGPKHVKSRLTLIDAIALLRFFSRDQPTLECPVPLIPLRAHGRRIERKCHWQLNVRGTTMSSSRFLNVYWIVSFFELAAVENANDP